MKKIYMTPHLKILAVVNSEQLCDGGGLYVGLQLMRVMGVQMVVVVPIMMETLSGEQQVPNTLTVGTLGMIDVSTFPK